MSFTSLASAWLFALLIPIVVFYFLKLKRPRIEIPSLVLWRQVLSDQRVNSPFQRFKRHLLLLLQLLLLALLVLAAMQPFLHRGGDRGDRQVILLDVSASMAALDREGGRARLDEAREKTRAVIDNLLPAQELSLIAFSRHARRLTAFTDNRRDLRAALDALEVEDVPSDLEEALRTAQALARSASFDKVLLLSDGNFPAQANFELPFAIDFQRLTPAGPNLGITALEARRTLGGKWTVFLQIDASAPGDGASGTVELRQDGAVVARENVVPGKAGGQRLSFTLASESAAAVHVALRPTGFDALASDNDAWLRLPAARALRVYAPPGLASYRHALATLAGVNLFPSDTAPLPPAFDLVISDAAADLALPAPVRCGIGLIPDDVRPLLTVEPRASTAIDWRRDSPLLQHVSLADVLFTDEAASAPAIDDARYAALGYEILAHSARGPLILTRTDDTAQRVNVLLHTDRSTLPYRVGFPIFAANLVQAALQRAGLATADAPRTGVLPALALQPGATYRVESPVGISRLQQRSETADDRGQLTGLPAPRVGEYVITGAGADGLRSGVSLLSPSETALTAVESIQFNDRLTVNAATAATRTDRPLWWPLAAAGFALLLIEWWWFQRRISPTNSSGNLSRPGNANPSPMTVPTTVRGTPAPGTLVTRPP